MTSSSLRPAAAALPTSPSGLPLYVRKKLGGLAIRSFFEGTARALRDVPIARPETHDIEVTRDVAYLPTGLAAHTYDVWRPKNATGPLPLCFYIHGGAFRALSKDTHWIMALAFARRGMVVVLPNYRLAPDHPYPAAPEDVAAALRHAVDHNDRFGIDVDHVVVAGESAGANLALHTALGRAYARPEPHLQSIADIDIKAVVAACGVFEVGRAERFVEIDPQLPWFFRDRCSELAAYLPRERGVAVDGEGPSPLLLVERRAPSLPLPPVFLPVGGGDFLKDDHARMERALLRWGGVAESRVYGRELHAFHAFVWRKEARRCWADIAAFLRGQGIALREPPPVFT